MRFAEVLHQVPRSGLRPGAAHGTPGAEGADTSINGEIDAACSFSTSCSVRQGRLRYELTDGSFDLS